MFEKHIKSGCKIGKVIPKLKLVEPFPYPVNQEAVLYLTEALEKANSGEFRSIGFVAVNARGHVTTAYSVERGENPLLLSGGMDWLKTRFTKDVVL
jgi:hypothetical protein